MKYFNVAHYVLLSQKKELKMIFDTVRSNVEKEEYAFYHKVIKGCKENKIFIDYLINYYLKKKKKLLDIEYSLLSVGIYLLLFTKKKDYSIVNKIVNEIKSKRKFLAPVFNGVLRNIIRDSENQFKNIFSNLDEYEEFRIKNSINKELFTLFREDYSLNEMKSIFELSDDRYIYAVCFDNRDNIIDELEQIGINCIKHDELNNCIKIKGSYNITNTNVFKEGKIYIQSVSAQEVMSSKIFNESKHVLDLCASPGGKSIYLSKNIKGDILALDKSLNKVKLINENIERLNIDNIKTFINDATIYNDELREAFDLVIADVPCSATGVISKIPEVKLKRTKEDILNLVYLQRKIIDNAYKYLKKGGYYIYITCSLLSLENEKNIEYILSNTDLKICKNINDLYYNDGCYKTKVNNISNDYLFAMILRK